MMNSAITPRTGTLKLVHSKELNRKVALLRSQFEAVYINVPMHTKLYSRIETHRLRGNNSKGRHQTGMQCFSPSYTGKSTVVEEYARRINAKVDPDEDRIPVLYVRLQNATTSKKLLGQILKAIGGPEAGSEQQIKWRLQKLFKQLGVEILILDEIHHLAEKGVSIQTINALKTLLDDRLCPIVFVGTEKARGLFTSDIELANRITTVADMKVLGEAPKDRAIWSRFLVELDNELRRLGIFQEPSDFVKPEVSYMLLRVCGGTIGRAARLLQGALETSLRRSASRIEVFDISAAIDEHGLPLKLCASNPFSRA